MMRRRVAPALSSTIKRHLTAPQVAAHGLPCSMLNAQALRHHAQLCGGSKQRHRVASRHCFGALTTRSTSRRHRLQPTLMCLPALLPAPHLPAFEIRC